MAGFRSAIRTVAVGGWAASLTLVTWITLSTSPLAGAADLSPDKPIKLVGPEIEAILDIRKKEVRINRFSVDQDLPTGKLQHQLPKPYVVRLVSVPKMQSGKTMIFNASDWADGIGLKLKIEIFIKASGDAIGMINVTSQQEETTLFYSAQQLKVQQE
ncbi:MAG TPA: hypothetical protein VEK81_05845 [Burkholderiales bacterium]|nr:hypothetical protein [Burkholderiales bacterium]